MKKICLAALAFALLAFTIQSQQDSFKPLHQLVGGTWKMKTAKGYTCEQWKKVSETELSGKGFKLNGADTVLGESVQLTIKGNNILYIPTVEGQNDGKPVEFRLTSVYKNTYQFTNPSHDYPQIVAYQLIGKDSLNAWIDGEMNGAKKRIDFRYKRVN